MEQVRTRHNAIAVTLNAFSFVNLSQNAENYCNITKQFLTIYLRYLIFYFYCNVKSLYQFYAAK